MRTALAMLAALASFPTWPVDTQIDEAVELDPIQVTPQVNPLDEAYARLRKMLVEPCNGCPPLIEADRESVYLKVGKTIGAFTSYGLKPPELGYEERRDSHLSNDWRQAERMPEN